MQAPWGGVKNTGYGREIGTWGLEDYLLVKQVTRYTSSDFFGWYQSFAAAGETAAGGPAAEARAGEKRGGASSAAEQQPKHQQQQQQQPEQQRRVAELHARLPAALLPDDVAAAMMGGHAGV